eukprot:15464369-Alexandrium_andersonii.AAC.1
MHSPARTKTTQELRKVGTQGRDIGGAQDNCALSILDTLWARIGSLPNSPSPNLPPDSGTGHAHEQACT